MTGALTRMDVAGPRRLAAQGLLGQRGTAVLPRALPWPGFPNLFIVQGPGSPSAATNFVAALEQHVEWIAGCIWITCAPTGTARSRHCPRRRPEWIEHATSIVSATVLMDPSCNSWYNGANVPGKKRMYMGYTAGIPEYRRRCDEIATAGYTGFKLA